MLIVSQELSPFKKEDQILSLNGHKIADIIDLRYVLEEQNDVLVIRDNQELTLKADNKKIQQLSLIEEIPDVKTCQNKCLFCFIDQLPKGLRKTLYFKDDDWRLSFLSGNFATLTNVEDDEITRIIDQRISPLYISLHVTHPLTREKLISARIDKTLLNLKKLDEHGIQTHIQIVLCPNFNDKEILHNTIEELSLLRNIVSVGIVPVGLTKFHKNNLISLTKVEAKKLIAYINDWQKKLLEKRKSRWIYLSDEIFILAGEDVPESTYYEDYPQLENGIGLVRTWLQGMKNNLYFCHPEETQRGDVRICEKSVLVTGESFAPILKSILESLNIADKLKVKAIKNNYFGPKITVAGLITAKDILEQVRPTKEVILVPDIMVNEDNLFLDNGSFDDLRAKLPTARLIPSTAENFIKWLNSK